MEKTSSDILREAADLLEFENNTVRWGKGDFFKKARPEESTDACVMCAHGAIAYCGSKVVRDSVEKKDLSKANNTVENYSNILNHGLGALREAHSYARTVGLTYDFNDAGNRTKDEVVAKLREAASLAQSKENPLPQ